MSDHLPPAIRAARRRIAMIGLVLVAATILLAIAMHGGLFR